MSDDGLPRDERGLRLCAWCGERIDQPRLGRLRDYCGRTCRELAYRERRTQARIAEAVQLATATDSSVDESPVPAPPPPRSRRQLGHGPGPGQAEVLLLWDAEEG